jgi:tetratricopeptide (TPR) repeat protein
MAKTTAISLDEASQAVYGTPVKQIDWLSGAPYFVPLAYLDLDTANLAKFLARRLAQNKANALQNFDHSRLAISNFPNELQAELDKMRSGLTCLELADAIANSGKPKGTEAGSQAMYEALWDALEEEAKGYQSCFKLMIKEIDLDFKDVDAIWAEPLANVEPLLSEAMAESPQERMRMFREARKAIRDAVAQAGDTLSFSTWAVYGWLSWQLDENIDATLEVFSTALNRSAENPGFGYAVCARFFAYLLAEQGDFANAHKWAEVVAKMWPTSETYLERSRYAALMGQTDMAEREIGVSLKKGAMTPAIIWADSAQAEHGEEIMALVAKEQIRIRSVIRHEIGEWKKVTKKARDAAQIAPDINLPHDLMEGPEACEKRIDGSNFLSGSQLLREVTESKADLKCLALTAFQNEKKRRADALQQARMNIESAICNRDQFMEDSKQEFDQSVDTLRESLGLNEDASEVTQRGCSRGLFGGCSVFGLYAVMAVFMSMQGAKVGPTTPFGMFAIGVALLPVFASIAFLIGYTSKRMMAESKANSQIASNRDSFDKARNDANAQFRALIESCQAEASSAEQKLSLAEQALFAYQT